jgi:hypothetical protein
MSLFTKTAPMFDDYFTCERGDDLNGDYCLDALAAGDITFDEACGPCMGTVITNLDFGSGRELKWAPKYREAAGLDRPKRLRAIKSAGVRYDIEPGPNMVEES